MKRTITSLLALLIGLTTLSAQQVMNRFQQREKKEAKEIALTHKTQRSNVGAILKHKEATLNETDPAEPVASKISFSTQKELNSKISISVRATGEVTAEGLTPATLVVGGEEPTEYTLNAKEVVLKGAITGLSIKEADIDKVDLTQMPTLEDIDLSGNGLNTVDFSKNNALKAITIEWANLSSLKLPEATDKLEEIHLQGNYFETFDIAPYTNLNFCDMEYNSLSKLDVSANKKLAWLFLNYNELTAIDVSQNNALEELAVGFNKLTSIEVGAQSELTLLDCRFNQITALDVSHNPKLKYLYATGNLKVKTIDITTCPELKEAELSALGLASLDLSANNKLEVLKVANNKLTTLDIANLKELLEFNAAYSPLSSIDFSQNTKLEYIDLSSSKMTSLSLPQLPGLTDLVIYSNAFDPDEMGRIIEMLPTVPAKDAEGKALEGWVIIQHKGENETLLKDKGFNPIKVYKQDVAKATKKNWKLKIYVPGDGLFTKAKYEDYTQGIETAIAQIATEGWHVVVNNGRAILMGAREGAAYRVYSYDGRLLLHGNVHSSAEPIAMDQLDNGTYLVVVEGKTQPVVL